MGTGDDKAFEELAANAGTIMGQSEIEARQYLGDARYEEIVNYTKASNQIALYRDAAVVNVVEQRAHLLRSLKHLSYATIVAGALLVTRYWVR